jgi:RNA polymerase sigma factor (sigma-70 family)
MQRFYPLVLRRARKLLGDEQAAEDVGQEVMLRVLMGPGSQALASHPLAWLLRTTTNLCFNRLRNTRRAHRFLREMVTPPNAAPSPELHALTRDVLNRLPPSLSEIAMYYFVQERSQREIAGLVGTSYRTVGNRLSSLRFFGESLPGEGWRRRAR